jgi:hypothetical protein
MDKHENNLPTAMQLVNALDGVSQERLKEIIDELRKAAANEDNADSGGIKAAVKTEVKREPVLEI